ncbi:MAG: hypothetical protein DRP16_05380 [Candidatus Aenigmatarchaeota archaeon]|nr:MAG: hypothetical protein DRP16_05380 [Candidatus Aenigmarchaeota archaeon]
MLLTSPLFFRTKVAESKVMEGETKTSVVVLESLTKSRKKVMFFGGFFIPRIWMDGVSEKTVKPFECLVIIRSNLFFLGIRVRFRKPFLVKSFATGVVCLIG